MKRVFLYILIMLITVTSWPAIVEARSGPTVYLNDKQIYFDVPPLIIDGRTVVPMRAIFEALGATVTWDSTTQTAHASKGSIKLSMRIGSNVYDINGVGRVCDVSARIVDGRTLVPLRVVSEGLGCVVDYNEQTNAVTINKPTVTNAPPIIARSTEDNQSPPLYMQANPCNVGNGESNVGTVTISEAQGGSITRGTLTMVIDSGVVFTSTPRVAVVEGDLMLGKPSVSANVLNIPVVACSSEYSTIEISDIRINVANTVPEGCIRLTTSGKLSVVIANRITSLPDNTVDKPSSQPNTGQYMSDIMKPFGCNPATVKINQKVDLAGVSYSKGYQMQMANGLLNGNTDGYSFNLQGKYTRLQAVVGSIDSYTVKTGTVEFYGDGRLLDTVEVSDGNLPANLDLDVTGVSLLKIYTDISTAYATLVIANPIIK